MWSEEDEEFIGLCAEFAGLSWLASTAEDALKGIRSVVEECIRDMARNNEDIIDLGENQFDNGINNVAV